MNDYQIFISYRRNGGEYLAARISDKLSDKGYKVFFDVESLRSGPFNKQLLSAIDVCEDVILILPPNALDRCVNEDDWVRQEIAHSIKNKKNIIPIMMRNFEFPSVLPEDIDDIRYYEAVTASTEYFDAVLERIEKLLISKKDIAVSDDNANEEFVKALGFLRKKLRDKALKALEQALEKDEDNSELHFYYAVSLLQGKRPFLQPKAIINDAETYINTAMALNQKGIYSFLLALIKLDFYENRMLRAVPSSSDLIREAYSFGVSDNEINELFDLMGYKIPVELK